MRDEPLTLLAGKPEAELMAFLQIWHVRAGPGSITPTVGQPTGTPLRRQSPAHRTSPSAARRAYYPTFASNATKHGTKSAAWVLHYDSTTMPRGGLAVARKGCSWPAQVTSAMRPSTAPEP